MKTRMLCALMGALATFAATSAQAEEYPTWTLSGFGEFISPDEDRIAESDAIGFGIGIGRYFGPNFSLDLEFDRYEFDLPEDGDAEIENIGLMARYYFDVGSEVEPFIGFGIGTADHDSPRGDGSDFTATFAGGMLYPLTDRLDLRGELRYRFDGDNATGPAGEDNFKDLIVAVGVQYALGMTGEPAVAPMPMDEGPKDSDGDGVYDDSDRCPGTPSGVPVDSNGCPKDSDNDGVPDYRDDCPNTAPGVKVGANGCAEEILIELPGVYFDFDKATLKPEAIAKLGEVVTTLTENDVIHVSVEGHTDWTGDEAYNQQLSERRARSVYDHLVDKGIASSRLSWTGYGESRPVVSNETKEGRARNRRVELRIVDR